MIILIALVFCLFVVVFLNVFLFNNGNNYFLPLFGYCHSLLLPPILLSRNNHNSTLPLEVALSSLSCGFAPLGLGPLLLSSRLASLFSFVLFVRFRISLSLLCLSFCLSILPYCRSHTVRILTVMSLAGQYFLLCYACAIGCDDILRFAAASTNVYAGAQAITQRALYFVFDLLWLVSSI